MYTETDTTGGEAAKKTEAELNCETGGKKTERE